MKNEMILEELEILRQTAVEMNNNLPETFLNLEVKNRLPNIILGLQTLSMNISNQANRELENQMPLTDEEWLASIGKRVRVLAELSYAGLIEPPAISFEGTIIGFESGTSYYIEHHDKLRGRCWFKMTGTKFFEFTLS